MKSWIVWIVALLLAAYILLAGRLIAPARADSYAQEPEIHIKDSLQHPFVKSAEIRQLLLINHLLKDSVKLDSLQLDMIESVVVSHPLVKKAEAYTVPSGYLRIDVEQRLPMMRVIGQQGQFFIDDEGKTMEMATHTIGAVVDVPVVTGSIEQSDTLLIAKLYEFAHLLSEDAFWDAMIEQIDIHADKTLSLYLRLCDFEVYFGRMEKVEEKLAALRTFYQEALPKVGWDIYSRVSLEFDNQIVCTKKK